MKKIIIVLYLFHIIFYIYSMTELEQYQLKLKLQGYSESEQLYYIGFYHYLESNFEDAIEAFSTAKSMELPSDLFLELESTMAKIYIEMNELGKAIEHINNGMKHNPDNAYRAKRLVILKKVGFNVDDDLQELLKNWKPDEILDKYLICDILLKLEKYNIAIGYIHEYEKKLNELGRDGGGMHFIFYAHAYYQLGEYNEALKNIKKAKKFITQYNDYSYMLYWDALIKFKLGKKWEAHEILQKGIDNGYDYHDRFLLLFFWRFSDENIKLLEEIESFGKKP